MAPAGLGWRIAALVIDGIIYLILTFCVVGLAVGTGSTEQNMNPGSGAALILDLISIGLILIYFFILEATAGATLGKLAVGLRVVNDDGSRIGFRASLIRNLLRVVDAQPVGTFLVAAFLAVLRPDSKRLGDLAAKTMVVRKPWSGSGTSSRSTPSAGSPPPASPI